MISALSYDKPKMNSSKILVAYHDRAQHLFNTLTGTAYSVPYVRRWEIITNLFLETILQYTIVMMF